MQSPLQSLHQPPRDLFALIVLVLIIIIYLSSIHLFVDSEFGLVASVSFGASGLADKAGGVKPPPASPAPIPSMRAQHW